jgi:hypothetical protein
MTEGYPGRPLMTRRQIAYTAAGAFWLGVLQVLTTLAALGVNL